ncbi:hypothetical protein ACP70R_025258 [Stipagrostis hirtigluma subsp. patula]
MADEHAVPNLPGGNPLPRTGRDSTEEEKQKHRPAEAAEAEDEEGPAKRPKPLPPPPSPTKSWKDKARSLLFELRAEQATLYDPKTRSVDCCRGFNWYM